MLQVVKFIIYSLYTSSLNLIINNNFITYFNITCKFAHVYDQVSFVF